MAGEDRREKQRSYPLSASPWQEKAVKSTRECFKVLAPPRLLSRYLQPSPPRLKKSTFKNPSELEEIPIDCADNVLLTKSFRLDAPMTFYRRNRY